MKALIAIYHDFPFIRFFLLTGYYVTFYMFTKQSSELYVVCELLFVNAPSAFQSYPA